MTDRCVCQLSWCPDFDPCRQAYQFDGPICQPSWSHVSRVCVYCTLACDGLPIVVMVRHTNERSGWLEHWVWLALVCLAVSLIFLLCILWPYFTCIYPPNPSHPHRGPPRHPAGPGQTALNQDATTHTETTPSQRPHDSTDVQHTQQTPTVTQSRPWRASNGTARSPAPPRPPTVS